MTHCTNIAGDIWRGEPINGVQHPQNIVNLWTDEELAAIGLTRVVPALEQPTEAIMIRAKRGFLLASEVDPIASNILRWADLTPEKQTAWAAYRRALLDIPQQVKFPKAVVWPTKPE